MKRAIALSLAGAVGAICASASAYADNAAPSDAPSVYVAPMIQYSLQGNDPEIKDNFGYDGGIGVNLPAFLGSQSSTSAAVNSISSARTVRGNSTRTPSMSSRSSFRPTSWRKSSSTLMYSRAAAR